MKKPLIILFILLSSLSIFSQNKPRIAVLPFEAINVSEADSRVVSGLFETALVNTNVFDVIEQNQIKKILEVQVFSLSGCTDEACAVEVGKLLSAEQIILGSFSQIGKMYILNAKIIDVVQGKNIRANNIQTETLAQVPEAAKNLAYSLAGLTYQSGGTIQTASVFGELLISTEPSGAEIYINGVKRGISPDIIDQIPVGIVNIEVRKGNLFAWQEVNVESGTREIKLTMKVMLGNLFIRSSETLVEVWLDGQRLGPVGSGLFKDIPLGKHKLELKGNGLYYAEYIELLEGITLRKEVHPQPVGAIEYILPQGSRAKITDKSGFSMDIINNGSLKNLGVGEYRIIVSGDIYQTYEETITLSKGQTITFAPVPKYNEKYTMEQQIVSWIKSLKALEESLEYIPTKEVIKDLKMFISEVENSTYRNEDIINKAMDLLEISSRNYQLTRIRELQNYIENLKQEKEKIVKIRNHKRIFSFTSLGISAASFCLMGTGIYLAAQAYTNYIAAQTTPEKIAYREKTQLWDNISLISSIAGGITLTLGITIPINIPSYSKQDLEIARTSKDLAELMAGLP